MRTKTISDDDTTINLFVNKSYTHIERRHSTKFDNLDESNTSETKQLLNNHEYQREATTDKVLQQNEYQRELSTGERLQEKEHQREATTKRKVFIMVVCLYIHFINGGTIIALGVIYVDLINVFNAPHSQAALVQSLFMGIMIGGGVMFTGVLQKYGSGLPVVLASLIAWLAFFASSFAPNVPTIIALIGVIGGLAMCINYLSAFVSIGWTFRENRKSALALLTMGWTIGQIAYPYIAQYLVEKISWNGTFIILSGFILNCIPCGLLLHYSKQFFFISKEPPASLRDTVHGCIKDYIFVIFVVAYFLFLSLAPIEMWFVADLTILKGFDRSTGSMLLSLLGIFGFVGRVFGILLLQVFKKTEALVHAFYSILIWGVGHFLVGYFDVLWGLVLGVALRGISAGISIAAMPGSQIELRGVDKFPQTLAICNLMGGVAQVIGGVIGGATVDLTGGYDFIFNLAAVVFAVCGLLIAIVWLLLKRQKRSLSLADTDDDEKATETEPLLPRNDYR